MAWSPSNPPVRGGSYSRFVVKRAQTLPPSSRGVVALPYTHDWGPLNTFVSYDNIAEWIAINGQGGDPANNVYTPGYIAAYNAFKGENDDTPGAARVIGYRVGGTGVLAASKALQNTTPAAAITLTAIYPGTRGNNLKVSVEANAQNFATQNDLVVWEGSAELERWPHNKTDITGLAALINSKSVWLRASNVVSGTALTVVAATNLTGGADGAALAAGDWTAIMTAFESQRFEVFVPFDLTDTAIQASLNTWAKAKNNAQRSKRFMLVTGGIAGETLTTALARATAANDENIATLGVGTFKDTVLNTNLSTSQLAPRLAGVIVQRGYDASISLAHLQDLVPVVGPSDTDITTAITSGIVIIGQDSAGSRFELGVTTYTSDPADKPKKFFGNIKYVFTMESFERTVQERHEGGNILGRLDNNADTREFLVGDAQTVLDQVYVPVGAVQQGARVLLASDPPASDDQDFVALDWIAKFGRSVEQIRNSFYLS
jgi:hypothetical protein